jgi:hypothetical protein
VERSLVDHQDAARRGGSRGVRHEGRRLYAFLSLIGSGYLSVQGRYLAPVWLLLLSVYGIAFARMHLGQLFVVGVLLLVTAQNLDTLISYYHA